MILRGVVDGAVVGPGFQGIEFEVEVDAVALLREIGRRAADSPRGVTKLQAGAVVVKAVRPC